MQEFFQISPKDEALVRDNAWSLETRPQEENEKGNLVYLGGKITATGRVFQYYFDDVFGKYWYQTIFRREDGAFESDCKHIFGKEEKQIKRPR